MKKLLCALLMAALLLPCAGASAAEGKAAEYRLMIAHGRSVYNIRKAPSTDGEIAGALVPGHTVYALGEEDGWIRIVHDGGEAFVVSEALDDLGRTVSLPEGDGAAFLGDCVEFTTVVCEGERIYGIGEYLFGSRVLSAGAVVAREQDGEVLLRAEGVLPVGEDGRCIRAKDVADALGPVETKNEMLRLTVTAQREGGGETVLYDRLLWTAVNGNEEFDSVTKRCSFRAVGAGDPYALTDGDYAEEWLTDGQGGEVTVEFPDDYPGGALTVSWSTPSPEFSIACLDGGGKETARYVPDRENRVYRASYPVPASSRSARISLSGESGIAEIRVYAQGQEHDDFTPLPDKTDLLVFSAHLDDELLWFGGAIPYYTHRGKTVGIVYMTKTGWTRRRESLSAMWDCGVTHHPLYLDMADRNIPSLKDTVELWGYDAAMEKAVEAIRRCRPDVILTHDFAGEYGHNQHVLTAVLLSRAFALAADPQYGPESARRYGAWQAKKLYVHRYEGNAIRMDWEKELEGEGGLTALDTAKRAFKRYVSQREFYEMTDGRRYDYNWFGLYASAVGPDVRGDDFFENIDPSR